MELREREFIDLSKYPVERRRKLFTRLRIRDDTFCVVYRTEYGYQTSHNMWFSSHSDMLKILKNAAYKERTVINNLGRM